MTGILGGKKRINFFSCKGHHSLLPSACGSQ